MPTPGDADAALLDLLRWLRGEGYDFVTPTPATIARVVARPDKQAAGNLRDFFGWNLPLGAKLPHPGIEDMMARSGLLSGGRSRYRVARLGDHLFLHSAFPTEAADSVFFGPDTYRFVSFLRRHLVTCPPKRRLVDLGAGSGVGGISVAELCGDAEIVLVDTNPQALRLAGINAQAAGMAVQLVHAGTLSGVAGDIDTIIANPPFIMDGQRRAYRHGGDMLGARLSLDWAMEAAKRITPGGQVLIYTGSAIRAGTDHLRAALEAEIPALGCNLAYEEIDPDIFGEELERDEYREAERIAAVGIVIRRQSP